MRRRTGFGLGLIAALALTACGQGRVSVVVELEDEDGGEAALLEDIEVRLLPYDRDRVFDSLTQAAPTPEPVIPDEIVAAREEIAELQREWNAKEAFVADLREQIKDLDEQIQGLNPAMNDYKRIYDQLAPMIDGLPAHEAESEALFESFNALQTANIDQINDIRGQQEDWERQAFRDVGDVIDGIIEVSGLEQLWDTTGAEGEPEQGVAVFANVAAGEYWVYARFELPYDELYWNVPITVTRGEPVIVRLNRANAILRQVF